MRLSAETLSDPAREVAPAPPAQAVAATKGHWALEFRHPEPWRLYLINPPPLISFTHLKPPHSTLESEQDAGPHH